MPEISEYNGNKILVLNPGARFTFSFGLSKAKLILEHFEAIKKFVDSNGETCITDSQAGSEEK